MSHRAYKVSVDYQNEIFNITEAPDEFHELMGTNKWTEGFKTFEEEEVKEAIKKAEDPEAIELLESILSEMSDAGRITFNFN